MLGVQSAGVWQTQQAQQLSQNHDAITIAPYLYSLREESNQLDNISNNEELFGPLFAETQEINSAGFITQQKRTITSSSRPNVELSIYEVNLHADHGRLGASQAALDALNPSLGASLAASSHLLQSLQHNGIVSQAFFMFPQYSAGSTSGLPTKLWGIAHDYDYRQLVRPHYFTLQLINEAIKYNMITTTHTGDNPSWNQARMNTVNPVVAKYILSYAFKGTQDYSIVLFNLHRTSSLQTTLNLPFTPLPRATLKLLTSPNITDNNEQSLLVVPVTYTLTNFAQTYSLTLPPYSLVIIHFTRSGGGSGITPANPAPVIGP